MATVSSSGSPFAHRLTGGYKCQSRPYAHRTYTPALISTYSPYCLHVTTNVHQSDTRDAAHFCACHAPKVRASAGSLSSSSFVRRDQRVRSHTHLAAALVRHDDHAIPVDTIGFPRSESPDLCEASSALVPYYRAHRRAPLCFPFPPGRRRPRIGAQRAASCTAPARPGALFPL